MRGDFVQQQYRIWLRFRTGKSRRLGQNQVQNQRFLLAGRAFGRRRGLFAVTHQQDRPGAGRSGRGPPRRRGRARRPARRQPGLDVAAGDAPAAIPPTRRRAPGRPEGKGRSPRAAISACSAARVRARAARHGRAGCGQPRLQRGQPGRIGRALGQQPRALAHGPLVGADRGRRGPARRRTPAGRRTAAARWPPRGTGGPARGVSQTRRRSSARRPGGAGLAVDPHDPPRRAPALSSPRRAARARRPAADLGGDRPGPARASPGSRRPTSAMGAVAQAAARGEEADRLQEVGLAGPVRPEQEHRPPVDLERGLVRRSGSR